jgi:hypothetical protein
MEGASKSAGPDKERHGMVFVGFEATTTDCN